MMDLLAQAGRGGGGTGNWINNIPFRLIFWAIILSLGGIAAVIKKAREKRAQRDAELRRQNRDEQILRTGRPDGTAPELPNAQSVTMRPATAEDARKKLQELAERRRRELAEMMRRAQEAKGSASTPVPPTAPQARPLPRPMPQAMRSSPPPPVRTAPQVRPAPVSQSQRNIIQPPRTAAEDSARRKQLAETKRRAEKEADARRKVEEQQEARRAAATRKARDAREAAPAETAYELPVANPQAAVTARQVAVSGSVGAALARVGGSTAAAEWRRALVMSELLSPPMAMR